MKYTVNDLIKLMPKDCQVDHVGRVIMIVLDFLIYMKKGDSISIPGDFRFEKISEDTITIPEFFFTENWREKNFTDVVNMLLEYKLIKGR